MVGKAVGTVVMVMLPVFVEGVGGRGTATPRRDSGPSDPDVAAKETPNMCEHDATVAQLLRQVGIMTAGRRVPLADQAAQALLDRVRAGEWALGTKLPGETTLAPQLGVGRSTMREAIRQLAGKGVLTTRQGAGVFVSALDTEDSLSERVSRSEIVTVLEARLAVEVEAARLAARRRTAGDLITMSAALDRRSTAPDAEYLAADTAFHRSVVVASHNPILIDLFDSFAPRSTDALSSMLSGPSQHRSDHDHRVHEDLLEAISAGDAVSAERRSRDHLQALIGQVIEPECATASGEASV